MADNIGDLNSEQWDGLQELASRFEKACSQEEVVEMNRFLPPLGSPLRPHVLHELIKIELEKRWRGGKIIGLESYLEKFPELGGPAKVSASLIYEEYRVRHVHGDRPQLQTYKQRFPEQFAELQRLVRERPPTETPKAAADTGVATTHQQTNVAGLPDQNVLAGGGNYNLIKRIGTGGFGEVWRAEAPGGIEVAVKIIFRPLSHAEAQQELNSLELIKRLRHPFLLQTQAYFSQQDRLFIIMDLADGSLRDRLKECKAAGMDSIPTEELVTYTVESAEALDFLHSERVQHRDIKPENILLLRRHAKLADFGLAKVQEASRMATATGSGTPLYMAPEIWRGKRSQHSDQYSLALTYAEMRLGRRVFSSNDMMQVMIDHLERAPKLDPIPAAEQQVLLRALAKDPEQRFPSCLDFARALRPAALAAPPQSGEAWPATAVGPVTGGNSVATGPATRAGVMGASFGPKTLPADAFGAPGVPNSAVLSDDAAMPAVKAWQKGVEKPLPSRRGLLLAGAGAIAVVAAAIAALKWPSGKDTKTSGGKGSSPIDEGDVTPPPTGFVKDEGAGVLMDHQGKKFYDRIVTTKGEQRVVFRTIPSKRSSDPRTFYLMENKVWNDLLRTAAKDAEFNTLLLKFAQPPFAWTVRKQYEKHQADGDGRLPAFWVTVTEAHCFALWMNGTLPTARQWDKASGHFEEQKGTGPFQEPLTGAPGEIAIRAPSLKQNETSKPMPVGTASKDESPFHVRDMAGNGFEWTQNLVGEAGRMVPVDRPVPELMVLERGCSYLSPDPLLYKDLGVIENGDPYGVATGEVTFRVVIEP